jgi:hypothetical protein
MRPLTKPTGGFFVGCSVEGLLALGSVRAHVGARAPKQALINGARYDLKVFRSGNNRHVRTFYPMFKGAAEPVEGGSGTSTGSTVAPVGSGGAPGFVPGSLRVIAALINPEGHDPGNETLTLINLGKVAQDLAGWRVEDRNGRSQSLSGHAIEAGETVRIRLDPHRGPQLSNKGGKILLIDAGGNLAHVVTYSKGQARDDGRTVLF